MTRNELVAAWGDYVAAFSSARVRSGLEAWPPAARGRVPAEVVPFLDEASLLAIPTYELRLKFAAFVPKSYAVDYGERFCQRAQLSHLEYVYDDLRTQMMLDSALDLCLIVGWGQRYDACVDLETFGR